MFARRLVTQTRRASSVAAHGPKQVPWYGSNDYAGCNWTGKGALPFQINNRFRYAVTFWGIAVGAFLVPFIVSEQKVGPLREEARKKAASA